MAGKEVRNLMRFGCVAGGKIEKNWLKINQPGFETVNEYSRIYKKKLFD